MGRDLWNFFSYIAFFSTSLSLKIVSAPMTSLFLVPYCRVPFSTRWPIPGLDKVCPTPGPLDSVLCGKRSRLSEGPALDSSRLSLGSSLVGPNFSLWHPETSSGQVLDKLTEFSLWITWRNPVWSSVLNMCLGISLLRAFPGLTFVSVPPSLFSGLPSSVFLLRLGFSFCLSLTRGLCSGVTSAARTKWVWSSPGPLSTPEI